MLSADPDSILGRIYNFLGQNLHLDKIFIDFGFDPNHFTWDAVAHRVIEVAIANINTANVLALVGAAFYVATLMMRTIVPLRVIGIISITFFYRLWRGRRGGVDTFALSSFASDQRDPPPPNAHFGQEGAAIGARRLVDGLAQAIHDTQKVPQG